MLKANSLEPLAEVEGALLVVEVLHLPHPKLLGLLGGREHFCGSSERDQSARTVQDVRAGRWGSSSAAAAAHAPANNVRMASLRIAAGPREQSASIRHCSTAC